jgi:hypothetical protein
MPEPTTATFNNAMPLWALGEEKKAAKRPGTKKGEREEEKNRPRISARRRAPVRLRSDKPWRDPAASRFLRRDQRACAWRWWLG